MNRLALGTAQFGMDYGVSNQGGQVEQIEVNSALGIALSNGVNTLDTAIAYGNSESALGVAGVDGFNVITKLPEIPDDCKDVATWVRDQVNASLIRLDTNRVYGLLLHRPSQLFEQYGDALYSAMQHLRNTNVVEKIGVSIYSPNELTVLTGHFDFDLIQAPFNITDQRLYTSGWLAKLKKLGVEVHVRSVFLQGLLLMSLKDIPHEFASWTETWGKWHAWLNDNQVTALEACLYFALSFNDIDKVVVGINSAKQLKEILNVAGNIPALKFPDITSESERLINPAKWSSR